MSLQITIAWLEGSERCTKTSWYEGSGRGAVLSSRLGNHKVQGNCTGQSVVFALLYFIFVGLILLGPLDRQNGPLPFVLLILTQ